MDVILLLLKFLLCIFFFIPAGVIASLFSLVIPPILSFCGLGYLAYRRQCSSAQVYNILMHLFFIASNIAYDSNPGMDDSFLTFGAVVDSIFYSSLFTFFAFIFFILYSIVVFRFETKVNEVVLTPKPEEKKCCLHCGTMNEKNSSFCSNCGMRMSWFYFEDFIER